MQHLFTQGNLCVHYSFLYGIISDFQIHSFILNNEGYNYVKSQHMKFDNLFVFYVRKWALMGYLVFMAGPVIQATGRTDLEDRQLIGN